MMPVAFEFLTKRSNRWYNPVHVANIAVKVYLLRIRKSTKEEGITEKPAFCSFLH